MATKLGSPFQFLLVYPFLHFLHLCLPCSSGDKKVSANEILVVKTFLQDWVACLPTKTDLENLLRHVNNNRLFAKHELKHMVSEINLDPVGSLTISRNCIVCSLFNRIDL